MRLPADTWRAAAREHRARVDALIGDYLHARQSGATHPVIDFLFTYYPYRPASLQRWHPGFGVVLGDGDAGADSHAAPRGYERVAGGVTASRAYLHKRASTIAYTSELLSATASRTPRLGCFGLHEWAMVYREGDARRHSAPLRLGAVGTDAVVESMSLQCTHYDAFRFFTEPAVGRNALELTRESQIDREQPGCLHASMDLYRLTAKLMPLVDSNLLLRSFELAYAAREIDMRASPYDLREYGYAPIPIETAAGRADYVRAQSAVAERAAVVRQALLDRVTGLAQALTDPEVTAW
ncbi:3-methyladenine DNA glycosylase [Gordonia sp. TBRC 11910]|uniref:3-methyladenine DNA glycosylase n=1 Tax=Gordonia asplenii TaxID=2725283 RepID=A0A848KXY7_9ACTN|nr:3-methyladenine DNA glycosylase [Gordonia asplenii]